MTDTLDRIGDRRLIASEEWLRVIQQEYLADYIQSGGSAVKVISGKESVLAETRRSLRDLATEEGYYFAELDPGKLNSDGKKRDLHRIDRTFFAITRAVDWKGWAASQARAFLQNKGIHLAAGRRLGDVDGIARDNGREPEDLLQQYQAEFATPLIRDRRMAAEFRAAMTALGRAQLIPDAVSPTTEDVLLGWLAGKTMPGAPATLKKVQIYERINLTNARHILASFCHWLPATGQNGLVVVLDFRPYEYKKLTLAQKRIKQEAQMQRIKEAIARGASSSELAALMDEEPTEPAVTYTDAAYMQMLTLIRRFIDEIDWFERFLLVILTDPDYYDPLPPGNFKPRRYTDYDALQTRIGLEVHDARRANPAASLVHLGEPA